MTVLVMFMVTSMVLVVIVVNDDADSSCVVTDGVDYDGYGFN